MADKKTYTINSISDVKTFSQKLLNDIQYPLILFVGELGAGKTTIIKSILKELSSEDIGSSPSYALINNYKTSKGPVYHIDLYRLKSADEAFQLGIEEILYSGNYCFIEWPQIIFDYLDPPFHLLEIELMADNSRKISLS